MQQSSNECRFYLLLASGYKNCIVAVKHNALSALWQRHYFPDPLVQIRRQGASYGTRPDVETQDWLYIVNFVSVKIITTFGARAEESFES